jgi:hypothetical protein
MLSWREFLPHQGPCFIRQADSDERATVALGTVFERGRQDSSSGEVADAFNCSERLRDERFINRDANALSVCGVVDLSVGAVVAVLSQEQDLRAHLGELGWVRARRCVGAPSALVFDGNDLCSVDLHQVHFCRHSEPFRRKPDGTGDVGEVFVGRLRVGGFGLAQRPLFLVHATVDGLAIGGEGVVRPLALYPFEIHEPLAVQHFIDHASRHEPQGLRKHR